jgi:hypothetical protein
MTVSPAPPVAMQAHGAPPTSGRSRAGTPATRAGRCECCSSAYPAGTPILWDRVAAGWVLTAHRSAGTRHAPQEPGITALL